MSTIIEVHNLEKQYAPTAEKAVKGISFAIKQGEIFSLLGPNGAGKTTTISMISCLLSPTAGDATVAGHSIRQEPMKVKQVIGVVPQEIALYDTISARENFSGTDLIVGARTGPVQLLLYSVFRIGDASNNIRYSSFRQLAALPQVAWAIPISLGDSTGVFAYLAPPAHISSISGMPTSAR